MAIFHQAGDASNNNCRDNHSIVIEYNVHDDTITWTNNCDQHQFHPMKWYSNE